MDYQKLDFWQGRKELAGLAGIKPPVKAIWYRGRWDAGVVGNGVTVVGARRMTEYGRRVLEKLIPYLVFAGKTIVSGFMYGVDQYAHNLAIENGGKTIAVLGWGIKERLQMADDRLRKKIIDNGGLVISEWEDQPSTRWTFAVRDRILAGLSQETYVIEAGIKSGSLITAGWANKLERKLWAVPGPITSKVSEGTNWLIAEGKARMWTGTNRSQITDDRLQSPLIKILENETLTADELARKLGKPVNEIGAQLSLLTLTGKIKEKSGKYYLD